MKILRLSLPALSYLVLAFWFSSALSAQAPPSSSGANADILKMIQAGLPETVIVDKIRERAGHWDTGVDALVSLRKSGATDAELSALTARPAQPLPAEQLSKGVETSPSDRGVQVLGGTVTNHNGTVIFHVPSSQDQGSMALDFQAVIIDKHVALRLSMEATNPKGVLTYGDLIINGAIVTYRPYINAGPQWSNPFPRWSPMQQTDSITFSRDELMPKYIEANSDIVSEDYIYVTGKGFTYTKFWHPTRALKKHQWAFRLGEVYAPSINSVEARKTFDAIMTDFDKTLSQVLQAAKIVNPDVQLSEASFYRQPANEELAVIVNNFNTEMKERQELFAHLGKNAFVKQKEESGGGNGFLALTNALQGILNMQQAMSDARAADATHSGAGQMAALLNMTKAEVQTINAVSDPSAAPIQAATPSALSQQALLQEQAKLAASTQKAAPATSPKSAFKYVPMPTPTQNASVKFAPNTGTAKPADCAYLSDSQPCVPLAQYQQMQSKQQASGVGLCPASGFVPGVMIRQASDVAVGVPCKPGTPYGPLIATTADGGFTGVTPPNPAPASGGGGLLSGGDGSSAGEEPFDPILNNCIALSYKNDPITGDHLILQNNCSIRARVWFYASSQVYGAESLDPGDAVNTYAGHDKILAAGGVSIYACPVNDTPRQADGTLASNGVNNHFRCSRK